MRNDIFALIIDLMNLLRRLHLTVALSLLDRTVIKRRINKKKGQRFVLQQRCIVHYEIPSFDDVFSI